MRADKVKVTIEFEALSIDCIEGMLGEVVRNISKEVESGFIRMSDGDEIKWKTERLPVEF